MNGGMEEEWERKGGRKGEERGGKGEERRGKGRDGRKMRGRAIWK